MPPRGRGQAPGHCVLAPAWWPEKGRRTVGQEAGRAGRWPWCGQWLRSIPGFETPGGRLSEPDRAGPVPLLGGESWHSGTVTAETPGRSAVEGLGCDTPQSIKCECSEGGHPQAAPLRWGRPGGRSWLRCSGTRAASVAGQPGHRTPARAPRPCHRPLRRGAACPGRRGRHRTAPFGALLLCLPRAPPPPPAISPFPCRAREPGSRH